MPWSVPGCFGIRPAIATSSPMSCIARCLPEPIVGSPPNRTPTSSRRLRRQRSSSESTHRRVTIPSVVMGVRLKLGVADPVPLLNATRSFTPFRIASGDLRWLERKRCLALNGLPSRIPLVMTATIKFVPSLASRNCSGASLQMLSKSVEEAGVHAT